MAITGRVENIRNFGKAYNITVDDVNYGFGFDAPDFEVGDVIEFDTKQNGKYTNVDNKTVKLISKAAEEKKSSGSGVTTSSSMSKNDYWEQRAEKDEETQKSIKYQAARNSAISTVELLISNGLVTVPKQALKYDFTMELIDNITGQYYEGTESFLQNGLPPTDSTELNEAGDELDG